ncbi:hypothetical protein BDQ17DRAFT_872913 [Cyathus striatus]|nr:hypothetical protein BDQ17DRAFT_872913 [Cyathus striatus]
MVTPELDDFRPRTHVFPLGVPTAPYHIVISAVSGSGRRGGTEGHGRTGVITKPHTDECGLLGVTDKNVYLSRACISICNYYKRGLGSSSRFFHCRSISIENDSCNIRQVNNIKQDFLAKLISASLSTIFLPTMSWYTYRFHHSDRIKSMPVYTHLIQIARTRQFLRRYLRFK